MSYDQPTTLNLACGHKVARHRHGTRACYTLDSCRCDPCADARLRYDRMYKQTQGEFPRLPSLMVDAGPVRDHVEKLAAQGMGHKRIVLVAGVPHGTIAKLVYGDPQRNRPPSRRVFRSTAERLFACPLDLADGAKVPRDEFDALLAELLARGWSKRQIGKRVTGPQALSLQAGRGELVFAGTIRILRRLTFEPVPLRLHGPSGRMVKPRGRAARMVDPVTPGVPDEPDVAALRRRFQAGLDRQALVAALGKVRAA